MKYEIWDMKYENIILICIKFVLYILYTHLSPYFLSIPSSLPPSPPQIWVLHTVLQRQVSVS